MSNTVDCFGMDQMEESSEEQKSEGQRVLDFFAGCLDESGRLKNTPEARKRYNEALTARGLEPVRWEIIDQENNGGGKVESSGFGLRNPEEVMALVHEDLQKAQEV